MVSINPQAAGFRYQNEPFFCGRLCVHGVVLLAEWGNLEKGSSCLDREEKHACLRPLWEGRQGLVQIDRKIRRNGIFFSFSFLASAVVVNGTVGNQVGSRHQTRREGYLGGLDTSSRNVSGQRARIMCASWSTGASFDGNKPFAPSYLLLASQQSIGRATEERGPRVRLFLRVAMVGRKWCGLGGPSCHVPTGRYAPGTTQETSNHAWSRRGLAPSPTATLVTCGECQSLAAWALFTLAVLWCGLPFLVRCHLAKSSVRSPGCHGLTCRLDLESVSFAPSPSEPLRVGVGSGARPPRNTAAGPHRREGHRSHAPVPTHPAGGLSDVHPAARTHAASCLAT
jgi:hypothetical protein